MSHANKPTATTLFCACFRYIRCSFEAPSTYSSTYLLKHVSSLESFFIFKNYSNPFFFFRNCAESFGIRLVIRMLTCNARSQSYLDKQRGAFHCSTISTVVERESIKAMRGPREGEPPYPSNLVQSSHGHTLPPCCLCARTSCSNAGRRRTCSLEVAHVVCGRDSKAGR
jgi:hypothetical protein